ncbi:MAG: hypothetical protein AAGB24_13570 [Bacteroidota bacterium]
MPRHLYFVCPTDGIEPTINGAFGSCNYFYTSLGNSVVFDKDTMGHIKGLLLKHDIQEIFFVLSDANPIIKDAMGNRHFSQIRGLGNFYAEISRQKQHSEVLCSEYNRQSIVLSYYLNKKIKELMSELNCLNVGKINIEGKIYNKQKNIFNKIYSDLVCTEYFSRN